MLKSDMADNLDYIDKIIEEEIKGFSEQFFKDYCDNDGKKRKNIVNKNNNFFISALGRDIILYSALVRSLDSSLGNRIQTIAQRIAEKNYIVKTKIEGQIPKNAVDAIADLLDEYEHHRIPKEGDIETIYKEAGVKEEVKGHKSDYYLTLKTNPSKKFLMELKIGGDLDNKKAQSEKVSLLKQYVILRNSRDIAPKDDVKIFFCTAYNKNGENEKWVQERVGQFFSENEIKVGRDFWNFVSNSPGGYEAVKTSYAKHAHYLKDTLKKIVAHYSG